jgi:hypothetical protein
MVLILTFLLIFFIMAATTQVFQQFGLVGSLGLGTTSIDHQCCMPPLLHDYVVLCDATNGPVHPILASLYSGCSLAFAFPLLQCKSFFCGRRQALPQPICLAMITSRATLSHGAPHIISFQFYMCARRGPSHNAA